MLKFPFNPVCFPHDRRIPHPENFRFVRYIFLHLRGGNLSSSCSVFFIRVGGIWCMALTIKIKVSYTNFRPSPPPHSWRWSGLIVIAIVSLSYRWCPQLHHHNKLISRRGALFDNENWEKTICLPYATHKNLHKATHVTFLCLEMSEI